MVAAVGTRVVVSALDDGDGEVVSASARTSGAKSTGGWCINAAHCLMNRTEIATSKRPNVQLDMVAHARVTENNRERMEAAEKSRAVAVARKMGFGMKATTIEKLG